MQYDTHTHKSTKLKVITSIRWLSQEWLFFKLWLLSRFYSCPVQSGMDGILTNSYSLTHWNRWRCTGNVITSVACAMKHNTLGSVSCDAMHFRTTCLPINYSRLLQKKAVAEKCSLIEADASPVSRWIMHRSTNVLLKTRKAPIWQHMHACVNQDCMR